MTAEPSGAAKFRVAVRRRPNSAHTTHNPNTISVIRPELPQVTQPESDYEHEYEYDQHYCSLYLNLNLRLLLADPLGFGYHVPNNLHHCFLHICSSALPRLGILRPAGPACL